MPVGTQASVKGLWQEDLEEIGYDLILANTYHLSLRPGEKIAAFGGVKPFMGWEGHALLTDSGGFQAFSLSDRTRFLDNGVEFSSHIDGSKHLFTPESVLDWQILFGSDIMMVLDDCAPGGADESRVQLSLERTHRWADASVKHYRKLADGGAFDPLSHRMFGIVQGGVFETYRAESARVIQSMPFDGIAVGGLSVGESREDFYRVLGSLAGRLDAERPRYLMGVGTIPDFLEAVRCGIDMFDCVLPTRNARNGQALTSQGKLNIRNASHALETIPIDDTCQCRVCRRYSRGYIRHLFVAGEMLGPELMTYHNLYFFYDFMRQMREAIREGNFGAFYTKWRGATP
jgi:queuine tRNA-ribosyltransferase